MEKRISGATHKSGDAGLLDKAVMAYVSKDWKRIYRLALKIALIHFMIGAVWILLSDRVLESLTDDSDFITFMSIIKGLAYVIVMSIMLYLAIYALVKSVSRVENEITINRRKIIEANKDLELLNEQLHLSQEKFTELHDLLVRNQEELHYNEKRFSTFLETSNDAIWEESNDGARWFSERWFEITGFSPKDMDEIEHMDHLIHPSDREKVHKLVAEHIRNKTPYYSCEYRIRTKSGEYKWIKAKGKVLHSDENNTYRMIGVHMDLSEINEYKEKLQHVAQHDQLTGLQNRLALNNKMQALMKDKDVGRFALLYIDIDRFKNINDTLGHSFGDTLLLQVAERLKTLLPMDALYRIGGDEFVVLIEQFSHREEVERCGISIIKAFKTPLMVEADSIFITASIGVSLYPEHGIDAGTLLKNADIAVYKAKEGGRNRIVFYIEPLNDVIEERINIEKNLWLALVNNEFELYYQPQYDLERDSITGFEALIRWHNPELGIVMPDRFIGIAEDNHLIIPIGTWVLKTACAFLQKLHQSGYQNLNISVNISILQLLQEEFVDIVMDTIRTAGIDPKHLELEITESILMESYESIASKLQLLRSKGIKIALDDFGKGYSSLNYLKSLPITTLKIDKVFVDTINENEKEKSFTDLIVNLGRSLDLCVIAEGVETLEQKDYLAKHKCNKIQGYLFSKPLPEYEILQKMDAQWSK